MEEVITDIVCIECGGQMTVERNTPSNNTLYDGDVLTCNSCGQGAYVSNDDEGGFIGWMDYPPAP